MHCLIDLIGCHRSSSLAGSRCAYGELRRKSMFSVTTTRVDSVPFGRGAVRVSKGLVVGLKEGRGGEEARRLEEREMVDAGAYHGDDDMDPFRCQEPMHERPGLWKGIWISLAFLGSRRRGRARVIAGHIGSPVWLSRLRGFAACAGLSRL